MTACILKRGRQRWPFVVPPCVRVIRSGARDYYYFRRGRAPAVRLPCDPIGKDGLPDLRWWTRYRELLGDVDRYWSIGALITFYVGSAAWCRLSPASHAVLRPALLQLARQWGDRPASALSTGELYHLHDALGDRPGIANTTLRALSSMLSWAVCHGYLERNPCLGQPQLIYPPQRATPAWSEEDVALLQRVAAPELWRVAALSLATAQPLHRVLALTWADVAGNQLAIRNDGEHPLALPLLGALGALVAAPPRTGTHLLNDAAGRPWTLWRFREAWRLQMRSRTLRPLYRKGLTFSGLRRTAITRMVAAGCTRMQVTAVTGITWETLEPYFAAAAQRRDAAAAMARWEQHERRVSSCRFHPAAAAPNGRAPTCAKS